MGSGGVRLRESGRHSGHPRHGALVWHFLATPPPTADVNIFLSSLSMDELEDKPGVYMKIMQFGGQWDPRAADEKS